MISCFPSIRSDHCTCPPACNKTLWSECSRLITNAIIFYNAAILSQLLARKEASGDTAASERITQVSPVAWQHINFYGWYKFSKGPEPINVEAIVDVLAQHPLAAVEDET